MEPDHFDRSLIHLVLRHDQVLGRENSRIDSSVTQIDLHDFSRLANTYGLGGFHCVTPLLAQHRICQEILTYWEQGYGREYNPDRTQALQKLWLHTEFSEALQHLQKRYQQEPLLIGTSANPPSNEKFVAFEQFSSKIGRSGRPILIQFGTAWGLSPEQLDRCDWILPPVTGFTGYNHLSVRCAAAIIVDRLLNAHQNIGAEYADSP